MKAVEQTVELQQGKVLNSTPETQSGQGSGYVQVGQYTRIQKRIN